MFCLVCIFQRADITFSPCFVDRSLLSKFLCEVIESLQSADLVQQPLLVALLCSLQIAPGVIDVLKTQNYSSLDLAQMGMNT